MRGKPRERRKKHHRRRIIPAHAGQTTCITTISGPTPDHPRACGANELKSTDGRIDLGSSPRMRGKLAQLPCGRFDLRIIPAHAGQTHANSRRTRPHSDHPRACGANHVQTGHAGDHRGSSPRMRGKRRGRPTRAPHHRIIPAHAGQTSTDEDKIVVDEDHPRACGANTLLTSKEVPDAGSSPRMRGKLTSVFVARPIKRIIPAHAGQTHSYQRCHA